MKLSKSRYTAYCQCPKNLWFRVYHPEFAAEVDPAAQARFETDSAEGELAKRLFPGTVDVTTRNADGSLDLSTMIEKTRRLMDKQVTFQYSLHIKRDAAAPYEHRDYLAPSDGSDPRRALAEQLCRDIPCGVCTLAYNMSFERGRLKEFADACPDLAGHLMDIHSRMQDLLVPFREGNYYAAAMKGSFSIKSVLPTLFPNDPKLDYHNFACNVKNGGEAMTIFPKIKDMSPADAAAARESLLRYCELDTWAMVKVWEKLKEVIKNEY